MRSSQRGGTRRDERARALRCWQAGGGEFPWVQRDGLSGGQLDAGIPQRPRQHRTPQWLACPRAPSGDSVSLVGADAAAAGLRCIVVVLPAFQGRPPIYQERRPSLALRRRLNVCCQAQKAPGAPKGSEAANALCALHRHLGEPSLRANDASCTSQDGAAHVKPEGEPGVQEGGQNPVPRADGACVPSRKRKHTLALRLDTT